MLGEERMTTEPGPVFAAAMKHAVRYREAVAADPHLPRADYHAMLETLAAPLPEQGSDPAAMIDRLADGDGAGPDADRRAAVLRLGDGRLAPGWRRGRLAGLGLGPECRLPHAAPAAAAIEEIAERWLLDILDLPRESSDRLRHRRDRRQRDVPCRSAHPDVLLNAGWDPDADGLFGAPPVDVFIGADAHSSLFSSLQTDRLRLQPRDAIATDDQGRMGPAMLSAAIGGDDGAEDRHRAGRADQYRRLRHVRGDRRDREGRQAPGCMSTAPSGSGRAPRRLAST